MPLLTDNATRLINAVEEATFATIVTLCESGIIPNEGDGLRTQIRKVLLNKNLFSFSETQVDGWLDTYSITDGVD